MSTDDAKTVIMPAWLDYKQAEAYSSLSRTTLGNSKLAARLRRPISVGPCASSATRWRGSWNRGSPMSRTSGARVICTSRLDTTVEAELDLIVAVYRFVLFGSNARKKAITPDGSDDTEDVNNDRTDTNAAPE